MPTYHVDLPSPDPEQSWIEIDTFATERDAIKFVQEKYGADDKGRVCLVSEARLDEVELKECPECGYEGEFNDDEECPECGTTTGKDEEEEE
ncbi:hypothetical protein ACQ4M3_07605 [Leptolyngbya sp. AN03gr2]|uniref:hypothetical protein n=1 Tax=unclassified Leptolyngbya TaxID=2650499 RepID=UPI003D315EB0